MRNIFKIIAAVLAVVCFIFGILNFYWLRETTYSTLEEYRQVEEKLDKYLDNIFSSLMMCIIAFLVYQLGDAIEDKQKERLKND